MKLKWQQAPVKTQWGDDMVVASVAIDKDHTVCLYCERDQTSKVDSMFAQPAQQEPVASIFISGIGEREFDDWGHDLPVGRNLLYTSPPAQRKALTPELIEKMCPQFDDPMRREMWIIGFKAAHKIKENT